MSDDNNSSGADVPVWIIVFTIVYASTAVFFLVRDNTTLGLNGVGDYIAGVSSPIVFLWLIYGYFMQRQELEYQRKELRDQRVELKRSADNSEYQAKVQRAALQPSFEVIDLIHIDDDPTYLEIKFSPKYAAMDIVVRGDEGYQDKVNLLHTPSEGCISLSIDERTFKMVDGDRVFNRGFRLIIEYSDITGYRTKCIFANAKKDRLVKTNHDRAIVTVSSSTGAFQLVSLSYDG